MDDAFRDTDVDACSIADYGSVIFDTSVPGPLKKPEKTPDQNYSLYQKSSQRASTQERANQAVEEYR